VKKPFHIEKIIERFGEILSLTLGARLQRAERGSRGS